VTVRNDRPPEAPVQLQYRSSFLRPGFSTEHRNGRPPGANVPLRNRSSFPTPCFSTHPVTPRSARRIMNVSRVDRSSAVGIAFR